MNDAQSIFNIQAISIIGDTLMYDVDPCMQTAECISTLIHV